MRRNEEMERILQRPIVEFRKIGLMVGVGSQIYNHILGFKASALCSLGYSLFFAQCIKNKAITVLHRTSLQMTYLYITEAPCNRRTNGRMP